MQPELKEMQKWKRQGMPLPKLLRYCTHGGQLIAGYMSFCCTSTVRIQSSVVMLTKNGVYAPACHAVADCAT